MSKKKKSEDALSPEHVEKAILSLEPNTTATQKLREQYRLLLCVSSLEALYSYFKIQFRKISEAELKLTRGCPNCGKFITVNLHSPSFPRYHCCSITKRYGTSYLDLLSLLLDLPLGAIQELVDEYIAERKLRMEKQAAKAAFLAKKPVKNEQKSATYKLN
jgi:ribosomal protein S27AE